MQLGQPGQPQPGFANRSLAPVASGWTLVINMSRMLTLFILNQSLIGRLFAWRHG